MGDIFEVSIRMVSLSVYILIVVDFSVTFERLVNQILLVLNVQPI